jgi:hypothetical protein
MSLCRRRYINKGGNAPSRLGIAERMAAAYITTRNWQCMKRQSVLLLKHPAENMVPR